MRPRLSTASFASVVVSHDRFFLDNVVNDMAEIGRAYPEGILRVEGSYSHSPGSAREQGAPRTGVAEPRRQGAHRPVQGPPGCGRPPDPRIVRLGIARPH